MAAESEHEGLLAAESEAIARDGVKNWGKAKLNAFKAWGNARFNAFKARFNYHIAWGKSRFNAFKAFKRRWRRKRNA